jgi:flagellar biosynthesis GTPase FlhF
MSVKRITIMHIRINISMPIKRTITVKNNTIKPLNTNDAIDLNSIVGKEIVNNLTRGEERRLIVDIKQGKSLFKSVVLRDMLKRCPQLETNINNILNNVQLKSQENNISDDSKKRKLSQNQSLPIKKPTTVMNKKTNSYNKQSTGKSSSDILISDESIDSDESINSDDSDDQDYMPEDEYVEDGFVTFSDGDDSDNLPLRRNNPKLKTRSDGNLDKKYNELKGQYLDARIDINKILIANFNKDDIMWFYKNIKRMHQLDGKERFDLEDKIEQRYKLLTSLQQSNLYTSFNKSAERDSIKEIINSKHSDHVKNILLNKVYNVMNLSDEEYQKTLNWMDVVLDIPTEIKSSNINIKQCMNNLYNNLNQNLYGMDSTIQQVLQAVCTILTDPQNSGYILTLVGPPGVGKTTISTMIAQAIGMGFGQISCGSINDQATIMGHGSTYIGSKPGIFTQILVNNKQLDNVILLDEMDKLYDSKMIPILLHVLDRTQNNRFKDAFCPEIDIDLSKNFFVVAVNSLNSFDDALKDRLKIINVDGYTIDQKVQICTKHMIPRFIKKTGIDMIIEEKVIKRYVTKISPDISGVREIERFFGDIYEKILLVSHMGPKIFNLDAKFKIDKQKVIDHILIKHLTGITA